MSDDVNDQGAQDAEANTADSVNESVEASTEATEHPEWFKSDKYNSIDDQAKAYTELEKRFGSFTGAPDEYEVSLSAELSEMGVAIDSDDPLVEKAIEFAKHSNMSQEGFKGMIELYAQSQLAESKALEEHKAAEMTALGKDADKRIDGILQWGNANLDSETMAGLEEAAQSAASVKAIEALIAKTRNAPVAAEVAPAPSVTDQEVREMQFAKDEFGNRKINSDPAFKKLYQQKRDALYGTGEHRQIVG
jgi:hypothetical protein